MVPRNKENRAKLGELAAQKSCEGSHERILGCDVLCGGILGYNCADISEEGEMRGARRDCEAVVRVRGRVKFKVDVRENLEL